MPALAARGVELSWSERGAGAPVLLIHETATGAAVWGPLVDALGDRARSLVYDRRGWGASSAPDGYRRTTIEEQSEDAAVLIESAAADPAVACGAGIGAVIALDLLLRRPQLVAGAVLIEPPLLALVPAATEVLSEDRRALEAVAGEGPAALVRLYLSGGLGALGAGSPRLPPAITAPSLERPGSVIAELGATTKWAMPLTGLGHAERRSMIVTGRTTPALVSAACEALAARLARAEAKELDAGDLPPHLGASRALADLVVAAAEG